MKVFTDSSNVFLFDSGTLTHLFRGKRVVNYRFQRAFSEQELLRLGYKEVSSGAILE